MKFLNGYLQLQHKISQIMHLSGYTKTAPKMLVLLSYGSSLYRWLSGKLWYFQHNCVGDTIVSLSDIDIYCIYVNRCEYNLQIHANKFCYIIMETDMILYIIPQRAKFMGSTWGPPGSCRPQMGPMLAPWTLLSRTVIPKVEHGSNVKLTTDIPYFDFQCKLQGVYWIIFKNLTSSNGNIFHVTGFLWGESTSQWWIRLLKASDMEVCCFLWFTPE